MIENLPLLAPDTARGARTLSRCHKRLAARRRRTCPASPRVLAAERLFVAAVCVAYLITMVGNLLEIVAP